MIGTPIYSKKAIRLLESEADNSLMEKAGKSTAELARTMIKQPYGKILAVAGPGNNGGDAFVAARHLKSWGFDVTLVFTGVLKNLSKEAKTAYKKWTKAGGKISKKIPKGIHWSLSIDGIFGIGFHGPLSSYYIQLFEIIQKYSKKILSIDTPSGLIASTGNVEKAAIKASKTISFLGLKVGYLTGDGPDYCGVVKNDSLGCSATNSVENQGWLITRETIENISIAPRLKNSHKGIFGEVIIIGGAKGLVGAALLAGRAALRLGAGKVKIGLLSEEPKVDVLYPELMLDDPRTTLTKVNKNSIICIGPGLGLNKKAENLVDDCLSLTNPILIDADGLQLLSKTPQLKNKIKKRKAITVITPHPGEAASLLETENKKIQEDRVSAALRLFEDYNSLVVLKGYGSICVNSKFNFFVNSTGNAAMSVPGMGDVYCGILAALMAQKMDASEAILFASYSHGAGCDQLVNQRKGMIGITASDSIDATNKFIQSFLNS